MAGVIVTGAPRSGTSATTRLLDLAGAHVVDSADRVGGGPNNPTGHWESKTVLAINNQVLDDIGARWWCPPLPGTPIESTHREHAARDSFGAVHPKSPWVCKDPRFTVTLPFWRSALDEFACVIVLRRPDEVVASLLQTWPIDVDHATALWARALHSAFVNSSGLRVAVAQFPDVLVDVATWISTLAAAFEGVVELSVPPAEAVDDFVRRPRGSVEYAAQIPKYAWDLWEQLRDVAPTGVSPLVPVRGEDPMVEAVLGPLRADMRAGHPIEVRPIFGGPRAAAS